MKTSSAKAKGRRLCAAVREVFLKAAPELSEEDIVVTPSGVTGPDLYMSPRAKEIYPFVVEGKNQESLNIWAALSQARNHAKKETDVPLTCFTRNREGRVYVAMDLNDFIKLFKK